MSQVIEHLAVKDGLVCGVTVAFIPVMMDDFTGEDAMPVPGPAGVAGAAGATGPAGVQGVPGVAILLDGEPGEDGLPGVPGPAGPTGATGSAGAAGPQGQPGITFFLDSEPGEEGQRGSPGPNAVGDTTLTTLTGVLEGNGSSISIVPGAADGRYVTQQGGVIQFSPILLADLPIVTFPKIQDVSAASRVLGRGAIGPGIIEELVVVAPLNIDAASPPNLSIPAGSVTNEFLGDMVTQTFKGRTAAGTGPPEDLTLAQAKVLLGITGASGAMFLMLEGEQGEEGMRIPGPAGAAGAAGSPGIQGVPGPVVWLDGEQGEEGQRVPGPVGPTGAQGIQGVPGPMAWLDGDQGEEGQRVPGPVGPTGAQGIQGIQGLPGVTMLPDTDLPEDPFLDRPVDVAAATTALKGSVVLADQATMETATDATKAVTPVGVKWSPGVAKAWVQFSLSGTTITVNASHNVSSVTRTGAGNYTVNFTVAFSSANYAACVCAETDVGLGNAIANAGTKAAGSCTILYTGATFVTLTDTGAVISASFFGDQ
jgi:hypothetical protein